MVVRDGEKALVGWATTKSGDTAPATVVDGSQTSHSLQLAVRTEMRTNRTCAVAAIADAAFFRACGRRCSALQRYLQCGHSNALRQKTKS